MLLRGYQLVQNISALDLFITNVKYGQISNIFVSHQKSRKRSSPLKLKLNGCQESLDNFYIGTNNIQHLEREILSSVFHCTIDLNVRYAIIKRGTLLEHTFYFHLNHICFKARYWKLFAHKMTLQDENQGQLIAIQFQPPCTPLPIVAAPRDPN